MRFHKQCRWEMGNSIALNTMVTLILTLLLLIHAKHHIVLEKLVKHYQHDRTGNIKMRKSFKNYTNSIMLFYLNPKRPEKINFKGILTFSHAQIAKQTDVIIIHLKKVYRINVHQIIVKSFICVCKSLLDYACYHLVMYLKLRWHLITVLYGNKLSKDEKSDIKKHTAMTLLLTNECSIIRSKSHKI
eukprot:555659_1